MFDSTVDAYDRWFEGLLDALKIDRFRLVVHDWGGVAVSAASRRPDRVAALVVIDAVPLADTYRWHWVARIWRTPRLGEAFQATFNRTSLKALTRFRSPHGRPMPDWWLDSVVGYLDAGTKDAILRLYRSADPDVLARHGAHLADLRCPTLLVWGEKDPYIGLADARRYQAQIPGAKLEVVPGAGHWCTVDQPGVFDRLVDFLQQQ